jgi:Ribbon-helix-helix protein, copG family
MARPKGNRKEARLSVSLGDREYAELTALARRNDVSVAWVVRQAIHDLIQQEQDMGRNPELPLLRRSTLTKP